MVVLPRSNPLYEQIPSQKAKLPDMLNKMGNGGFTGYLGYGSPSGEAYALFIKGSLISTLLLEGERRKTGFEALSGWYDLLLSETGVFNIYRMTADLVMCTHALLQGEPLLQPQEVRSVDLKGLLGQMKLQKLNGTVLFVAVERSAMIFYREGLPIGFYHDAAREIENSPTESQRVAALPGATVEVRSSQPVDSLMPHNLLEMVNIDKLWETAVSRSAIRSTAAPSVTAPETVDHTATLLEIAEDLKEIATAYLSRQGAALVETLLTSGGMDLLLDTGRTAGFLEQMAAQSTAIDPEARIDEMVDLMRSEITGRLSL